MSYRVVFPVRIGVVSADRKIPRPILPSKGSALGGRSRMKRARYRHSTFIGIVPARSVGARLRSPNGLFSFSRERRRMRQIIRVCSYRRQNLSVPETARPWLRSPIVNRGCIAMGVANLRTPASAWKICGRRYTGLVMQPRSGERFVARGFNHGLGCPPPKKAPAGAALVS